MDETRAGFTRDDLMRALFREHGVHTLSGYPPVYWFTLFQKRGYARGVCPVAEQVYSRMLLLPLYARITDDEVSYVIESLTRAAHQLRGGIVGR